MARKATTLPPVRLDLPYTQEVVTPHVKWADPFVNGPLRAFFVNGVQDGRTVAELGQRLPLEPRVVSVDWEFAINRFWNPRYFSDRSIWADPADYSLFYEIIEEELARDVSYDLLVMHSIIGWNDIPESLRKRIYARVKGGEGLVLVHPQLGEKEEDKTLWEVSPLINVPGTKLGFRAMGIPPKEAMSGAPWYQAADHYVVNGIPFEAFPYPALQHYRYELGPKSQALVTGVDGVPVIAVKQYGKGRVVALGYHAWNLWPKVDAKPGEVTENFWEYFSTMLLRAMVWAAGKEPQVQVHAVTPSAARYAPGKAAAGKVTVRLSNAAKAAPVSLAVTVSDELRGTEKTQTKTLKLAPGTSEVSLALPAGIPAGGRHFVDVIASVDGKKSDFGTGLYGVRQEARIRKIALDQEAVEGGGTLTGAVKLAGKTAGLTLVAELWDSLGRVLARQEKAARGAAVGIALKCPEARANTGFVKCYLMDGDRRVDQATVRTALTWDRPKAWTDYEVQMPWHHQGLFPWDDLFQQRYEEAGITAAGDPDLSFWLTADIQFHGFGGGWFERLKFAAQRKKYGETRDRKYLMRDGCCFDSDETFRKPIAAALRKGVAAKRKYRPWEVLLCDESAITKYADAFDLCWCDDTLAAFRTWLKGHYRTLDALNAEWGTGYKDWAKVMPITWEAAQKRGNPAPWVDHRLYMNRSFANAFGYATKILRGLDPGALSTVCGTQVPGSHNGCDWSLADYSIDYLQPYGGAAQHEMHRSFNPKIILAGFTGYQRTDIKLEHEIWMRFFHGHAGSAIFWGFTLANPDLVLTEQGHTCQKVFGELRDGGMYRTIRELTRDDDGIALHYSMTSGHVWWVQDGKLEYGDDLEFSDKCSASYKRFMENRLRWGYVLEDAGYQYDWMPYGRLEEGGLKDYRALILPGSIALSDKEVEETKAFVKRGGSLIADVMPGTSDGHGKPRAESPLAELFATGRYGKGRAVLLNEWMSEVPQTERRKKPARRQHARVRRVLEDLGLYPGVTLIGEDGLHPVEVERVSWRDARVEVIGLLREMAGKTKVHRDGTVELIPTTEPQPALPARLRSARRGHWYDLRARKYLGEKQELKTNIFCAVPQMYGILPYKVAGVKLTAPKRAVPGQAVNYALEIKAGGAEMAKHVAIVEVFGPDKRKRRLHSGTAETKNGKAAGSFWLALNDQPGEWKLVVTDNFSGKKAEQMIQVG